MTAEGIVSPIALDAAFGTPLALTQLVDICSTAVGRHRVAREGHKNL
jgi:hypothetical protein